MKCWKSCAENKENPCFRLFRSMDFLWFFTESWGKSSLGARLRTRKVRGRQKGTKSPLDPFSRLGWSHFHAPSACSFLVLRLSPCLLPQLSVKNIILPVTPLLPHPPQHTPPPHPCSHSPAVLSGTSTAHDDPAPDYTPIESAVRRNPPAPSA